MPEGEHVLGSRHHICETSYLNARCPVCDRIQTVEHVVRNVSLRFAPVRNTKAAVAAGRPRRRRKTTASDVSGLAPLISFKHEFRCDALSEGVVHPLCDATAPHVQRARRPHQPNDGSAAAEPEQQRIVRMRAVQDGEKWGHPYRTTGDQTP
jgi:hypothetical protein